MGRSLRALLRGLCGLRHGPGNEILGLSYHGLRLAQLRAQRIRRAERQLCRHHLPLGRYAHRGTKQQRCRGHADVSLRRERQHELFRFGQRCHVAGCGNRHAFLFWLLRRQIPPKGQLQRRKLDCHAEGRTRPVASRLLFRRQRRQRPRFRLRRLRQQRPNALQLRLERQRRRFLYRQRRERLQPRSGGGDQPLPRQHTS